MQNLIRLKSLIRESHDIVVFTGAGISTESGIADYRSKGGLWQRFQPVTIQEFISSHAKRREYWQTKLELYESFLTAKPNAGHLAIKKIDDLGKLKGIITQNIDGLHQMAGVSSTKILELHGTNRRTVCLTCDDVTLWQETHTRLKSADEVPVCLKCGGLLKPDTISFGQALDQNVLQSAMTWARSCDCLLALGSTLVVEPAASLPKVAQQSGAKLAIVNLSETPLDDLADLSIHAPIGATLSAAINSLAS